MIEDILLVDDSDRDRILFSTQIARHGYEQRVVNASDGGSALSILDGSGQESLLPGALMILDIGLPDMDGLNLAKQIRDRPLWSDAPIIMLTGSAAREHVECARALGVVGYMLKESLRALLAKDDNPIARMLRQ